MARGRGMRRWWNWADSGRDSKSCQVMLGGNQIAGDQKAAEMDVIDQYLKQTTNTQWMDVLSMCLTFVAPKVKLEIT